VAKRLRLTKRNAKKFAKESPARIGRARAEVGRALSKRIAEEVKKLIPNRPGWFEIYRNAIEYVENSDATEWAVAGLSRTKLTKVPAESTQVKFGGTTPIAKVMRRHNPWTVDTIPGIAGGYSMEAEVRPASKTEIESHRARLRAVLPDVKRELTDAGAVVLEGEFPTIAGEVFVDLVFLAKRLELGLGGFRRIPHWLKVARAAQNKAGLADGGWVDDEAKSRVRAALRGHPVRDTAKKTDSATIKKLEQRRRSTWP
jgi:hypothetical protein